MKTANISYDALGRTTATIEAYVDGVPSDDDDRITRYTYDGNDNVTSLTADLPAGQNDQTTVYTYGVTTAGGSNINHNGLLAGVTYPSDGNPATSETETFTYNALGQTTSKTDRNGTVHSYGYDPLGRLVSDTVTTLGAGVDGAIRRLGYTYNSQGRPEKVTSYANTAGTNVVNQVQRQYNGFGQLVSEYQAHDGAVNTGSTPKVQYTYAAEDKGARPTGMVYPDGRVLSYGYGTVGSLNDRISRLSALVDNDGTTMLEGFSYLGVGTVVQRTHANGVDLTYIGTGTGEAGDQYVGLDRFGRVVDHNWTNGSTSLDHYTYVYDRNSNRTVKNNSLNSQFNESYAYDALDRLTSFERADGHTQDWSLDPLGNSNSVTTDGIVENRTHNDQNQLTNVGGTNLAFDANGNMTMDQEGKTLIYDAWNRLVEAKDGSTSLVRYEHDALTRRIEEGNTDVYHTAGGQAIEERDGATGAVTAQFVRSTVYVDAFVLRDKDTNGDGILDQRLYYQQDANFNVTSVSDDSGSVVQRFTYDPYGKKTTLSTNWQPATDAYGIMEGHQGGRYDPVTGLYHFHFREYSPELMRWVQQDPLGYVDGASLYGFAGSQPLDRLDPDGLEWQVTRQGENRATAEGDCGDTISDLADKTNMEASQFRKWLKAEDGLGLPTSADEPLPEKRKFSVPNVVFIGVGDMNRQSNWLTGSTPLMVKDILMAKGFKTDYRDWRYGTKWKSSDVDNYMTDLYGLVFFGHGGGKVLNPNKGRIQITDPWGKNNSDWLLPDSYYDGQFGVLILKSCFAEQGGWRPKSSSIAQQNGAVWLGNSYEVAGASFGIQGTAENAK